MPVGGTPMHIGHTAMCAGATAMGVAHEAMPCAGHARFVGMKTMLASDPSRGYSIAPSRTTPWPKLITSILLCQQTSPPAKTS